jgi:CDP-glucose 4,6-dehydratase
MEGMVDFKKIYSDKKVFITGHTGFKGSWLLAWLHGLGAEIKGYSLAPQTKDDLFHVLEGEKLCQSVIADIRDKEILRREILDFQPDFVFHLAAQPLVRLSYDCPTETFDINATGTAHVLDAIRFMGKPCAVICITTDKVYENREWHYPYRETDQLGGYDPYSASKAAAEIVIASYRSSFFNPHTHEKHQKSIASARAGNVIGGGDWSKDRIIPDIIRALHKKEPIQVRNPWAVRPWQHVLEPLAGYLQLGAKVTENPIQYATAWNFGPYMEDTLTVRDLVEITIEQYGYGTYETPALKNQPHEAGLLKLDINKVINELDWKPKWNARKAIEETIKWYKNHADAKDFTFQQIQSYQ